MISIAEAISELMYLRDTVVVPGLGAFVKKPVPAKVNPVANYFTAPSCEIEFDPNLREDNDLIVNYIIEKNEITEDEARRLLMTFVNDCFNSLKTGGKVTLNQLGTLSHDWAGDLVLERDKSFNYNADAFGLCDFSPISIAMAKSKDDIKAEIEQKQKDKNTPMTVDEKAVHEEDEHPKRPLGWLWILLGLLVVAGIGYGLYHLKTTDFNLYGPRPENPSKIRPWAVTLPTEVKTWNTGQPDPAAVDTIAATDSLIAAAPPVEEPVKTEPVKTEPVKTEPVKTEPVTTEPVKTEPVKTEPVKTEPVKTEPVKTEPTKPTAVNPEAKIRIIAGCFAQEDNASRMAESLKDKGYPGAFHELRGSKWYVAFGRYATEEEATAALRDIRSKGDAKAWILK